MKKMINKSANYLLAIALAFQLAVPPLIAGSAEGAPQSPAEVDTSVGQMRISGNFEKDWNLSAKCRTVEKDVQEITVSIGSRRGESLPPQLCISWSIPQCDIQYRWHTSKGCGAIPADWGQPLYSSLSGDSPILALMGNDGNNRLTFACSEAKRRVAFKAGVHEETNEIFCEISLFSQRESPLKNYSATIRLDTRGIPYCEAIGAAASGGGRVFCSGIFIVCRKTGARAAIFGGENAGLLLKRGGKMREGGWKIRRMDVWK